MAEEDWAAAADEQEKSLTGQVSENFRLKCSSHV